MTLSPDIYRTDRGRLFGLAYRMTGSAADAEDIVQDAFVRWHGADRALVAAPGAWLTRTAIRLCLTRLTSARARREQLGGADDLPGGLPEPVLTGGGALGPMDSAERRESVSPALLVLLERVTPLERAVFVLREAFVYEYADIADLLGISETYARQALRRAHKHIDTGGTRFPASDSTPLVQRFLASAGRSTSSRRFSPRTFRPGPASVQVGARSSAAGISWRGTRLRASSASPPRPITRWGRSMALRRCCSSATAAWSG